MTDATTEITNNTAVFNSTNPNWHSVLEYNLLFLHGTETYMNKILHERGHVFLNDVFDQLGIKRTSFGVVHGWLVNSGGDNFIDFGLFGNYNRSMLQEEIFEGTKTFRLAFNVNEGMIYEKI